MSIISWIVLCFTVTICVSGFNVDVENAIIHQGPPGSWFGFAVTQHRDRGTSWTLIGAPKAQTDQPGVDHGGAVFRCSTETPNSCQQMPFDSTTHNFVTHANKMEQSDDKSNQWFGATLQSSGENGVVVACAPRYVYFSVNMRRREPVGTCFVAGSSFQEFREYSPCRTSNWGYHRQGSCQAGFSASLAQDGQRLFVGAPGSWYWQGQEFSIDITNRGSYAENYNSSESSSDMDDTYLGYSTAVGHFNEDQSLDVAVGMPKGDMLKGRVVLYTAKMRNLLNITGDQLGAYFGYSLAVSDLNGDNLDDIIVGAPLYTEPGIRGGTYEQGKVYLFYQNRVHRFDTMSFVEGDVTKGRFGLSVAAIGDINRDGFQDIAVGAPYAGNMGEGAVYIFHGSDKGVKIEPSQIITPESIRRPVMSTFGFSISGGMDLDNNQYPDLIVGAYESDTAVYLRSRPVVDVNAVLTIDKNSVILEENTCTIRDGTKLPCVLLEMCMQYTGVGITNNLDMKYSIKLDGEQKGPPRAFFLDNEGQSQLNATAKLQKSSRYCARSYVYVQRKIRDKLSPIVIQAQYYLSDPGAVSTVGGFLRPVVGGTKPETLRHLVTIQKNCGRDGICIPDLQMDVKTNIAEYQIGSTQNIELDVSIDNRGEDAFETMMYLTFPVDLNYVKIERSKTDAAVTCGGAYRLSSWLKQLSCDIENPLPAGKNARFKVLLSPAKLVPTVPNMNFSLVVNSTNKEEDSKTSDNAITISLPVKVKVNMTVRGTSFPAEAFFNISQISMEKKAMTEERVGPEIKHVYEVINRGPSVVREAEIHLIWPTHNMEREPLFYLMDRPESKGKVECDEIPDHLINPLKVHRPTGVLTAGRGHSRSKRDESYKEAVGCGEYPKCAVFRCVAKQLAANDRVVISTKARIWQQTIAKMHTREIPVSSRLVTHVTQLQYDGFDSYIPHTTHEITTMMISEDVDAGGAGIPWWIILIAVLLGLLLLALLALCLYKLGFFKRKRPPHSAVMMGEGPERNGYQLAHGDERL